MDELRRKGDAKERGQSRIWLLSTIQENFLKLSSTQETWPNKWLADSEGNYL